MPESDHVGLPEPSPAPLPSRPAGEAWQRAKDGLPLPEAVADLAAPVPRRTPEDVRARWSCLSGPRHASAHRAEGS